MNPLAVSKDHDVRGGRLGDESVLVQQDRELFFGRLAIGPR